MYKRTYQRVTWLLLPAVAVSGFLLLLSAAGVFMAAHIPKFVLFLIFNICSYTLSYFHISRIADSEKRQNRIKACLTVLCFIYLLILLDFTLADISLGRTLFRWNLRDYSEFFRPNTNLIPFATIRLFLRAYRQGTLSVLSVVENLLGNGIAFMPLAFYLPCLHPKCRRRLRLFFTILFFSLGIELLQFLLMTGSPDVDDVLLNVLGALFLFEILQNPTITKGLSKLTFGVWNHFENQD